MDYQHFAIIFVLIVLPLSFVLSYYIENQTDTIMAQTSYQTKLTDSVSDAVTAYEMNSMNTESVKGESIKAYVMASVNTFFTTLATNFGMSSANKSRLQAYVPAVLFTTYDGYYIYSPIKTKQVAINDQNGQAIQTKNGDIVYAKAGSNENAYKVNGKSTSTTDDNSDAGKIKTANQLQNTFKNRLTTSITQAKEQKSYMLKPFIYYSAQYNVGTGASNTERVVASYSLDNYLTVYGSKNRKREGNNNSIPSSTPYITPDFSKSGYLINPDKIKINGSFLVKMIAKQNGTTGDDQSAADLTSYDEIYQNNRSSTSLHRNNVRYLVVNFDNTSLSNANTTDVYQYINYYKFNEKKTYTGHGGKTYSPNKVTKINTSDNANNLRSIRTQTGDEIIEDTLELNDYIGNNNNRKNALLFQGTGSDTYRKIVVSYNGVNIEDKDAKEYYIKAYFFSTWVKNNLGDISAKDVNQDFLGWDSMSDDTKTAYTNFSGDQTKVFDIGEDNDPESDASDYQQHKRNVIKNSIQYNLNSAISTYNDTFYFEDSTQAFRLPIIAENDWQSILNSISMTAFLQGIPAGTAKFNSYSTVQSGDNNTSVSIDNMYFVDESEWNNNTGYYHSYDCPELKLNGTNYIADLSARFKYDAERVLAKVDNNTGEIVCLYEDSTNTYYRINQVNDEISLGDPIPNNEITNYTYRLQNGTNKTVDLTKLQTAKIDTLKDNKFKYDHKNLACYTCNVSRNYTPVVKYYKGDLRRTYATDDGDLLVEMTSGNRDFVYYSNGSQYNGTITEADMIAKGFIKTDELYRRRKAVYTYIASLRNGLYKNNDYVNR